MARPVVSEATERLYAALTPLAGDDEALGWPLLKFCHGLIEPTFQPIHEIVSDRDDYPGWVIALDPDNAPAFALPYLAQFVGVVLTDSMTVDEQRQAIQLPEGFRRGTRAAMTDAVKRTLTGTKTVLIEERYEGNAYRIWVRTLASETPNEDLTRQAILSQKPIGISLLYEAVTGQAWDDVVANNTDWDQVLADFPTWADLVAALP